jgi:hypothetical protein
MMVPIPVAAPYLPVIHMFLGNFNVAMIIGFLIGHVLYFLEDVVPKLPVSSGRHPLKAPRVLANLL